MNPFRTQVKFFLDNTESVDVTAFGGVFQRWIQDNATSELLIDVADYRHVFEGPGIILLGHESDYAMESRDSRLGLLYTRKRQQSDLATQLRDSLRLALRACELLQAETVFEPRLKFRADEIEIRFLDRLLFPNRPETFDLVKDHLQAVLTDVYGSSAVTLVPASLNDPRYIFTVAVQAEGVVDISDLLHHFQPSAEQ